MLPEHSEQSRRATAKAQQLVDQLVVGGHEDVHEAIVLGSFWEVLLGPQTGLEALKSLQGDAKQGAMISGRGVQ